MKINEIYSSNQCIYDFRCIRQEFFKLKRVLENVRNPAVKKLFESYMNSCINRANELKEYFDFSDLDSFILDNYSENIFDGNVEDLKIYFCLEISIDEDFQHNFDGFNISVRIHECDGNELKQKRRELYSVKVFQSVGILIFDNREDAEICAFAIKFALEEHSPKNNSLMVRVKIEEGQNSKFWQWFSGSVMHNGGTPIKFYHGAKSKFDKFDMSQTGGIGMHFTTDKNESKKFGNYVIEAHLNIKNPAGIKEWKNALDKATGGNPRAMAVNMLKKMGYDGISTTYETIVFDVGQIWILR